jgi:hypothetical protein
MDLRYIYFAHRGAWKTAELVGGKFAHALSEVEVKVLSDIEAAQNEGKYQKNLMRLFEKAEFVGELKMQEDVIKMRRAQTDRMLAKKRDEVVDPAEVSLAQEPEEDADPVEFAELESEPITTGLFED